MYDKWLQKLYGPGDKHNEEVIQRLLWESYKAHGRATVRPEHVCTKYHNINYYLDISKAGMQGITTFLDLHKSVQEAFDNVLHIKHQTQLEKNQVSAYLRRLLNIVEAPNNIFIFLPEELHPALLPNKNPKLFVTHPDILNQAAKFKAANEIYTTMIKERIVMNMLLGE